MPYREQPAFHSHAMSSLDPVARMSPAEGPCHCERTRRQCARQAMWVRLRCTVSFGTVFLFCVRFCLCWWSTLAGVHAVFFPLLSIHIVLEMEGDISAPDGFGVSSHRNSFHRILSELCCTTFFNFLMSAFWGFPLRRRGKVLDPAIQNTDAPSHDCNV